jgi:SAM-dependent methyltransferase
MPTLYDTIGRTYARKRQPDPRFAAAIDHSLDGCASILNVGAGAGSYEPAGRRVLAVEPSRTMIAQRPANAAPAVQARAEALPFPDRSFDAVLGVLTLQHWRQQTTGLAECARVARSRAVFLTVDTDACARFWLFDYFPELFARDRRIFPRIEQIASAFRSIEVVAVPVPHDCRDGFLGAYWKRPREYLDPDVRASISGFSSILDLDGPLARLRSDIESGDWERRFAAPAGLTELDLGYRIVIARVR